MIARALAFLVLLYVLGYAAFTTMLPKAGDGRTTDAVVVLTGGAKRLERGLQLLEQGKARRMLISGVARSVRPVDLAARYPGSERLFVCCIDLGRQSVDTRSNGEETARWLKRRKLKSVRLVTTDWHMPRAHFELALHAGDDIRVYPDAIESRPRFRQLFREYNKYLLRRAAVIVGI
jgi:uncharacterized SAM-binding protein YcdF (DUF218 family)